jgi:hypothetical protein
MPACDREVPTVGVDFDVALVPTARPQVAPQQNVHASATRADFRIARQPVDDPLAMGAGHGEARGYALGLSLVRDPRFVALVNDIVIEEGSARYQDIADRFVRGEQVSDESLSQVWRNTTQTGLGADRPWTTFFHAVRSVNA